MVATVEIENMVVVGTGLMGSGIVSVSIEAGIHVTLVGRSEDKCEQARSKITQTLSRSAKRKMPNDVQAQQEYVSTALANLELRTDVMDADLLNADMIVEAIVENLKVKQNFFEKIEPLVNRDCILVTNTSSFLLSDVMAKIERREKFAGLHFFNPVPAMKLVELVRSEETSDETFNSLYRYCQRVGKTPVKCKDAHGFIVNRLLIPYVAEGIRMAERGDAEPRDIDLAMKLGAGHPLGPFEVADYIGLDTVRSILGGWHQSYPDDPRYMPMPSMEKLIEEGKLGRKTGQGFHTYPAK
ncbi:3-hydroxybutyryl-CoA dehydrogenase [Aphelenchoides besseyi]|nr:3-hydroxybutyryl-CoA dehydrogenase [Aphelenchoides besseyi]KAI6199737.1 3-hydroxybutyryl-CoA dehydrogenase [Aphelenchoides besseyi]